MKGLIVIRRQLATVSITCAVLCGASSRWGSNPYKLPYIPRTLLFRWPLRQRVPGTIRRWNGTGYWKTDGGLHYRRCQGVRLPVPAAVRGTTEGECGLLISKHVHSQLARCNPLFHFLNVLVPTGFVLVGHNNNNNNNNTKRFNSPAPFGPWPKIDWHFRRKPRNQLPVSEIFNPGTAL